ncbi:MAG TPA: ATP-binding cassette domain-containing protein [Candidatus Acidoferrum sp.]|nr:ATP-binding cassette domain-containing protein [Candidatus Acidoferrum sp.]
MAVIVTGATMTRMADGEAATSNDKIAVRLDRVSKSFGKHKVLDDVSFRIAAGQAFCILGKSGVGKSVTLKIMIGLIQPDAGKVFIRGAEILSLDPQNLSRSRKEMGFLFQNGALFDSISVAENVAFPLRRHTKKSDEEIRSIVRQKLKEVELENEGEKMPAQLSGGMSKRAARALALDPSILLVDEPNSGLDAITASEINDLLLRLKNTRKVTLVVVTHDIAGARKFSDRFAVLDCGKIAGCGPIDQLARSENPLVRDLAAGALT